MPHSVSPERSTSAAADTDLPDAPSEPLDLASSDASQESAESMDVEGGDGPVKEPEKTKEDVKLQDIFDDDDLDDDDEFLSSSAPHVKMESSPPAEPL